MRKKLEFTRENKLIQNKGNNRDVTPFVFKVKCSEAPFVLKIELKLYVIDKII